MSFLKITDPKKRDAIVKDYLKTKANIQKNDMARRTGEMQYTEDVNKLFKPVTDVQNVQNQILQQFSPIIKPAQIEPAQIEPARDMINLGPIAVKYLQRMVGDSDKTFGLNNIDGQYFIGNSDVDISGDDLTIGGKRYSGTRGLWELLTSKKPVDFDYDDRKNYEEILKNSDAMMQDSNKNKPKSNKSWKYKNIIKPIWDSVKYGRGFLPKDPDALVKRMELLIQSKRAGHNNVQNELVSILNELVRQKVIDVEIYKNIIGNK